MKYQQKITVLLVLVYILLSGDSFAKESKIHGDTSIQSSQKNGQLKIAKFSTDSAKAIAENDFTFIDELYELSGDDYCEGFNRAMFSTNVFLINNLMYPAVYGYSSVVPKYGMERIKSFFHNILFVKRFMASCLQAKFSGAGIETLRFLTNTTIGIAGFYDPAKDWFGLDIHEEDFGQVFTTWGFGHGSYLHLPAYGPTNVRDGIGHIFDAAFDPRTYLFFGIGSGTVALEKLNEGAMGYRDLDMMINAFADPYEISKQLYYVNRYIKQHDIDNAGVMEQKYIASMKDAVNTHMQQSAKREAMKKKTPEPNRLNVVPPEYALLVDVDLAEFHAQNPEVDTMRYSNFDIQNDKKSVWVDVSPWNDDFYNQSVVREIQLKKDAPEFMYKLWLQTIEDEDHENHGDVNLTAPLAVVCPGTGASIFSFESAAMAELLHQNGYHVAIMSNSFSYNFMEAASTAILPGFTPLDAKDMQYAIDGIFYDLTTNLDLRPQRKAIIGLSMGGLQTLFLAQLEKINPKLFVDKFIAINSPCNLLYAVDKVDSLSKAWNNWKKEEQLYNSVVAGAKYMHSSNKVHAPLNAKKKKLEAKNDNDKVKPTADGKGQIIDQNSDAEKLMEELMEELLPYSKIEAQALIALNFKITLAETIYTIESMRKKSELFPEFHQRRKTPFYQKVYKFTFRDYVKKYLLKGLEKHYNKQLSLHRMNEEASLISVSRDVLRSDKVRIYLTIDDLFVDKKHLRNLNARAGKNLIVFSNGGHLGLLYIKQFQDHLIKELEH
ncbi:VacJ family lipoprotein [Lentisphaerota bacterium WC36G]|nr:VacJ family lipoprotein [Lentisphaerae bacterium WC36]